MAVDGYIHGAIRELQSAIVQMQREAHDLERELGGNKQQLLDQIEKLGGERKMHEVEMAHIQDTMQQQALLSRIRAIEHDAEEHRSKIQQVESEMRDNINRKNQMAQQLQGFSTQFEQLLASPDVH
ncbi:MAG TPA: hypothetical protein VLF59_00975 [Candidatus Saccharimonadales bacterium]|nr:hypothetical protein [Candidatus Saccharimonadales bacterium]